MSKMKKILLKKVEVNENDVILYSKLIMDLLQAPRKQNAGTSYTEMRVVIPVMNKIEVAVESGEDHVLLTMGEYKDLVDRATNTKYQRNDRHLFEFIESIEHAESFDPDAPAKA